MSEFAGEDFEFAVGSIKGMRSWKLDYQGRLIGVTHPAIWKPGENVSTCRAERQVVPGCQCMKCGDRQAQALGIYEVTPHKVDLRKRHTFDADCGCGFWAYDEFNFKEHGAVVGIIAGYGKATIGTKGFRCEKATVLALHRGDLSLSEWLRLQQLYPKVEFFEDYDAMVTKHGGVLKTWDEVGDDFWDEPATREVTVTLTASLAGAQAALRRLSTSMAYGGVVHSTSTNWGITP
jgi:hypothetical protein